MTGPQPFAVGHDGRDLAGLDWGGAGEHLVLLHPNGFCAGLFDPLARRLASDFTSMSWCSTWPVMGAACRWSARR